MNHVKSNSLFLKFLMSYLLILLIPIFLINGLFGYRFIRAYQKEIQNQVDLDLMYLGEAIDMEMQILTTTVDQLRMYTDFNKYNFNDNPLVARDYIHNMYIFNITNPFFTKMALYLKNEEYIFTDSFSCQVDFFFNQLYRFETTPAKELKELLINIDHRMILPEQIISTPGEKLKYIIVLEPVYSDYNNLLGTCLFFIDSNIIYNRIQEQLGKYNPEFQIRDQSGQLLLSSFTTINEDEINNNYFISSYTTNQRGWEYTTFIPKEQQLIGKINVINQELLITTMFVIALASILIFILMKMNYSPIHKLRMRASSLLKQPLSKGGLETISSTLDYLSDQNQYLTSELKNNVSAIKSIRLNRLLTGHYISREDFNLDVEDLNLSYANDWFFVAVIQLHGEVKDYDTFALQIQDLLKKSIESYYSLASDMNKVILINGITKEKYKSVMSILEEMRISIKEKYNIELTIGVGQLYFGTLSIPKSYMEACSALDYRFIKGNGKTILYLDLVHEGNVSSMYSRRQLDQLKEAVINSDQEIIDASVNTLLDYIRQKNLPLFVAKGLCFEILSIFIEASISNHHLLPDATNMSTLMQLDTVDDVIKMIQKINSEMMSKSNENTILYSDSLLNEIMDYIKENCLNCNFSIQETAEHFHMLLPNLSQFFKEKTGQNILDFSTYIRMEKSIELLSNDTLSITDISQQVGYYNVSSFIRRFKQIYNVTPGSYRKQTRRK